MAELDQHGNVNVSHIGGRMSGPGGFIDISQGARNSCSVEASRPGGLRVGLKDGRLSIDQHGQVHKVIQQVAGITFAGQEAVKRGQQVTYGDRKGGFPPDA